MPKNLITLERVALAHGSDASQARAYSDASVRVSDFSTLCARLLTLERDCRAPKYQPLGAKVAAELWGARQCLLRAAKLAGVDIRELAGLGAGGGADLRAGEATPRYCSECREPLSQGHRPWCSRD
jgi:hypothetical protein